MKKIIIAAFLSTGALSAGPIAFGVNSNGVLFRFDVTNAPSVTEIGTIGFVPSAIDFRPSSNTLYALAVGRQSAQLYTIDIATAAPTAVGSGFAVSGLGYDLGGSQTIGFDFNPATLQGDNSMRIRVVSSGGSNLRLNSSTGAIANVDATLNPVTPSGPKIDAAAYINNIANSGGVTQLFTIDFDTDDLNIQAPANSGTQTAVGPMGVTIDSLQNIGFDIYTLPGDADTTIGGDSGYAVLRRPDSPVNGPLGAYLIYRVNLATGQITQGALVGPQAAPYDFAGGFALMPDDAPAVPEPHTFALTAVGLGLAAIRLRRTRVR